MSDFNVEISTTNNQLEIESSIINSLNFNEVNNTIETILSETITGVLEIESSANEILEISTSVNINGNITAVIDGGEVT